MSLSPPRVRTPAITWMWPEAIRGAMVAAGLGFAVVYALGCLIGQWAIVAVACVTAFAYAAVMLASRKPAARLLPAILVPAFALGMNEPVPDGFAIAGMFVGGSVWAALVAYCWPEKAVPARGTAQSPAGSPDLGVVRTYAFAFASAAGIGLAIGFLFDLAHVAWAAAAAMIGTRTSRWYVASGATGLLVLLMAGVTSTQEFEVSFRDRLGETAIGAALALAFGVALPTAARRLRARHV